MNIGIFTDTYEPQINGVVTSIKASYDYLSQHHNVYVFCPNVKPKVKSTEHIWRFPSIVYPFLKEQRLALPFNRKLQKIEALDLDIIHIHTPFTMGYIGLRIAKKLSVPVIHTYHTYFEKYIHYVPILPEKFMYKYAKKESERFCNQCQIIIVPTEQMKQKLSTYSIKPEIHILSNGVNNYDPTKDDIQKMTDRFQLSSKKICSFVGRLGVEKNIYFLLDAFEKINQKMPDIHLVIVGDGPERHKLEKEVMNKNLGSYVTFTGYLSKEDVFSILHLSKLMLFPSLTETQGLTVIESFLSGTPVIGIDQMGVKDVISDSGGGVLTSDNLDQYVDAALDLLSDENKRLVYSKQAKIRGKDFLSLKINSQLERIYGNMIGLS